MKWRFFHHLHGGADPDAERVYRWHIEKRSGARIDAGVATDQWKRSLDDYVKSAKDLYGSMVRDGFVTDVPIDPNYELLDGSHRVACAVAIGFKEIPVSHEARYVWAPPWGTEWFLENEVSSMDIARIMLDWDEMRAGIPTRSSPMCFSGT